MKNSKLRKLSKNPYVLIGGIIMGLVLAMIILGIFWMPYEPTKMSASEKLQGISLRHIMGTDNMGRDVFSRVMYGSRVTLMIAIGTIIIGAGVGTIIGAITGYYGGMIDEVTMRVIDALFAFPSILLALVIVSVFGVGWTQLVISLGIAFVPSFARIVRGEVLRCKNMDYIENARLQGVSDLRMIFLHILPNIKGVLASSILIGFNNAVLAEAGLSYLGVGSQPPYASLGRMLSDAQQYMFTRPSYVLCPGIVIVLMVLGFAFLGEGIKRWE
ncbi:peptide/nickel ABC transporter permease protein [Butyrivibrio proteoclasticus B316]|jgi:peptide/nickel transport system permease protein|uniref:Peptide/nickel ABC transporter permease protein n=1 Tax=Butyrivibrio proteoclasticus (strain ATCC 51982 / DSM 14932 / B316) TaxID=515622 RepID=E0RWR6_BUTPB|nr:ABC transporter permease [Butyrivibrio proteoclasticus]ADL34592.1 peptide/nickel ABC transporter permease protein [Butyrivibrio proteoclasticus B316]